MDSRNPPQMPEPYRLAREFAEGELLPRLRGRAAPADLDWIGPAEGVLRAARPWVVGREYLSVERIAEEVAGCGGPSALAVVSALATAAFESTLDLHLLADDTTGEPVRQALAFDRVRLFLAQEKWSRFAGAEAPASFQRERERVEEIVRHVWGFTRKGTPRLPEHWSGLRVSQRLEALERRCPRTAPGLEALYRGAYLRRAEASRTLGALGFPHPTEVRAVAWHRLMVLELFIRATQACATVFQPENGAGPQFDLPRRETERVDFALRAEFESLGEGDR